MRIRALASWVVTVLLSGCSQLPQTHYYVLEIDRADSAAGAGATAGDGVTSDADRSGALTIGVRPFVVDPPYDQERIVYRVGDRSPEVGFYSYHLWAAPLSSMLPTAVAAGLAGAAGVEEIEPVASGRSYGAFLLGRVLAVEEVDVDHRQLVRAAIELRLMGSDGEELWRDRVDARGETTTGEVPAIVEALGQALARALAETRGRLASALSAIER
ncbi:MAG TPA: ABC-type transport auxiliary lipoprotein family protein [Thermoanaerobaculia bacterium]|nr:ABC-type transport auxiliary lipoprotein family protein [Thermoanaerobaculia bacterium]